MTFGTAGGAATVSISSTGTVNAANFNTTSDATLKTNVETLTGSLDAVKSLRGVSYDWIESGGSEIGVIAQEVEAVLPDVVSTNDEGIKSVKYGNMVAVLIEAIKEQQLRIEALEAQLNS
jgi:aldehyde:ferredoxin oxidoreductase